MAAISDPNSWLEDAAGSTARGKTVYALPSHHYLDLSKRLSGAKSGNTAGPLSRSDTCWMLSPAAPA
ncbi:uncharacterized protein QC761_0004840 [Podospora bellae-mahoneyi]|uniref:Uncharacterized protein n=1 Tax=Podospora bellae-mahoneyi TaxID=2093777 RepID=A0ABR0FV38_9PEZI|nr:hypothetical protein QC761_0004840 [Podospora bellae-mahoneyi]